jgi:hypothetical protein
MTLREKQSLFATLAAKLILRAHEMGFAVTLGEAYRSPEEAARLASLGKGIKASLHTQRLAIDLNLFRDGVYLSNVDDYRPLGEWWETQSFDGATCCWGGRFRDGNHFSIGHNGRK